MSGEKCLILSWNQVLSDDGKTFPDLDHHIPNSFDLVVIDQCLDYLVPAIGQRCLEATVRILRIGGQLLVRFLDRDKLLEKWPKVKNGSRRQQEDFFDLIYGSHGPRRMVRKNLLTVQKVEAMALEIGLEVD